jgi:TonB family protein
MLRFYYLLLTLALLIINKAQGDTTYFDAKWKVCSKRDAAFFRPKPVKEKGDNKYHVVDYYINGKLQMDGYANEITDSNVIMTGHAKYYDEDGYMTSEGGYISDSHTGVWKYYRPQSNTIWYTAEYKDNMYDGEFVSYYKDGKVKRRVNYTAGKETLGRCYNEAGNEIMYTPFMQAPDGVDGYMAIAAQTAKYPKKSIKKNVEGRVLVKFVINKKGDVADVEVVESVHPKLDKEAVRVVENLPRCKSPAMRDDEPIKVYYTLPIKFKLVD